MFSVIVEISSTVYSNSLNMDHDLITCIGMPTMIGKYFLLRTLMHWLILDALGIVIIMYPNEGTKIFIGYFIITNNYNLVRSLVNTSSNSFL